MNVVSIFSLDANGHATSQGNGIVKAEATVVKEYETRTGTLEIIPSKINHIYQNPPSSLEQNSMNKNKVFLNLDTLISTPQQVEIESTTFQPTKDGPEGSTSATGINFQVSIFPTHKYQLYALFYFSI